jgi:hypothetical protein
MNSKEFPVSGDSLVRPNLEGNPEMELGGHDEGAKSQVSG